MCFFTFQPIKFTFNLISIFLLIDNPKKLICVWFFQSIFHLLTKQFAALGVCTKPFMWSYVLNSSLNFHETVYVINSHDGESWSAFLLIENVCNIQVWKTHPAKKKTLELNWKSVTKHVSSVGLQETLSLI